VKGRSALRLRRAAARILDAGLRAADPEQLVLRHLRVEGDVLEAAGVRHTLGRGRLVLVAAGKAAAAMARAGERRLGDRLSESIAVSNAGAEDLRRTRCFVAGHPLPDANGLAAARHVESLLGTLGREDLALVLLSGGASALLPAPAEGITLRDKARTTELLLRAGANIHELNCVRKHLSRLKGGGMAGAAGGARVVTLVLSDVVGDDLSTIASGPTVPDPTTFAQARAVLDRHGLLARVPRRVRRRLERGARGEVAETPKPGAACFRRSRTLIVGSNALSLEAAARAARREGFRVLTLTTRLEGEAREVGVTLAAILWEIADHGRPVPPPVCLLASGETTVTVRGDGRGGRNQELVAATIQSLAQVPAPALIASFATDGIDGRSDAAGGIADHTSLSRAVRLGLPPPAAFLRDNDSNTLLATLGDLIVTGPTGTNVLDLTLLLAGRP